MTDTGTHADGLNLEDTELLLHFVQSTAQSLSGGLSPDDRITKFWTTNAPLIGLSYPFVLHLIYALTAYHIAVQCSDEERKLHYKTLASKHLARGTAGLASTTSHLDDNNCGAAYLGATLMCYCNFAAGPGGPEDLMICYLGNKQNIRWINLVSGLRLIREAFTPSALFAGLMSPLSPLPGSPAKKAPQMPLCKKLGQAQLQWHSALADLKRFVILQEGTYAKLCLHPIAELVKLFEGIYGDESGNCGVSQDYHSA
ncbi:hypothetical protein TrVGV298_012226 [Trichoderma virens]|nr:hypothetical protein TrVGV298_012226 [Trichoderma virens]